MHSWKEFIPSCECVKSEPGFGGIKWIKRKIPEHAVNIIMYINPKNHFNLPKSWFRIEAMDMKITDILPLPVFLKHNQNKTLFLLAFSQFYCNTFRYILALTEDC